MRNIIYAFGALFTITALVAPFGCTGSEPDDAEAQFNLGFMYYLGEGVAQDDVHAHMWLNLAAAAGHEEARCSHDRYRLPPMQEASCDPG